MPYIGCLCQPGAYELVEVLGEGCFGVVYLGRKDDDGSQAAVKLLRGPYGHHPDVFEEERLALTKASEAPRQARTVRMVDSWQDVALGGCYCIATSPYCSGRSLEHVLSNKAGG